MQTKIKTTAKAPSFRVIPREHFHVEGIKRSFDISAIVLIYMEVTSKIEQYTRGLDYEMEIGRATIVYSIDKVKDEIHLITGWVGNRKKS